MCTGPTVERRSTDSDILTCSQCCHDDLCNSALCGQAGTITLHVQHY